MYITLASSFRVNRRGWNLFLWNNPAPGMTDVDGLASTAPPLPKRNQNPVLLLFNKILFILNMDNKNKFYFLLINKLWNRQTTILVFENGGIGRKSQLVVLCQFANPNF